MSAHLSEEEQVDALKNWWKQNGQSALVGIILGLGGVLGWQGWTQHQKTTAEQAGQQFEQLSIAAARGPVDSAVKQAELLKVQFEGSTYAVYAALELARLKLEQGDGAAAREQLQWVLTSSDDQPLQQIARLRLARLLLGEGDTAGAQRLVTEAPADAFAGEFAQLQGDIALAKDDQEGARRAYQEALAKNVGDAALVQMKLDDLAASPVTP